MRTVEFKMERPGLVHKGETVTVSESKLQTLQGVMYYYTIEPALAMSNNIPARHRLTVDTGTVTEVRETESASFVTVEFMTQEQ